MIQNLPYEQDDLREKCDKLFDIVENLLNVLMQSELHKIKKTEENKTNFSKTTARKNSKVSLFKQVKTANVFQKLDHVEMDTTAVEDILASVATGTEDTVGEEPPVPFSIVKQTLIVIKMMQKNQLVNKLKKSILIKVTKNLQSQMKVKQILIPLMRKTAQKQQSTMMKQLMK